MVCKRCQTELQDGSRFCPACGALQPMVCPACGAESRPGSKTCSACGKKLPLVDRPDKLVYVRRPRRTGELVAGFAIALVALLILGGAVYFLMNTVDFTGKKPVDPPAQMEQQPEDAPQAEDPLVIPEAPVVEEPPVEEDPAAEEETPVEEETPAEEEPPVEEEAPVEEEPPTEESPASQDWIFPDSSQRLLTAADVEGLSSWELKVARNEIYARHGRRFNSADLQNHFNSCSWYEGTVAPENFSDSMLNPTELANVQFLKAAE